MFWDLSKIDQTKVKLLIVYVDRDTDLLLNFTSYKNKTTKLYFFDGSGLSNVLKQELSFHMRNFYVNL